jgi:vacuolar protein-sorting-associated protein 4
MADFSAFGSSAQKPTTSLLASLLDDDDDEPSAVTKAAKMTKPARKPLHEPADPDHEAMYPEEKKLVGLGGVGGMGGGGGKAPQAPPGKVGKSALDAHQHIEENCMVPPGKLPDNFDGLLGGGVQHVKLFTVEFMETLKGAVLPTSGLLLFGPHGVGKSVSVYAIAGMSKAVLFKLSAADLPNGTKGAARIDALFEMARCVVAEGTPAIIYIDEIDSLLSETAKQRSGHFASCWGRFEANLLVIGATNKPWLIDQRLLNRFERQIHIASLSPESRLELMQTKLEAEEAEPIIFDVCAAST